MLTRIYAVKLDVQGAYVTPRALTRESVKSALSRRDQGYDKRAPLRFKERTAVGDVNQMNEHTLTPQNPPITVKQTQV